MTEQETHIHWQGRIVALEFLMQTLVTVYVAERADDPHSAVVRMRKEMFASMQSLTRPIGEQDDAIWAAAIEALERTFQNVAARISDLQGRDGPPQS